MGEILGFPNKRKKTPLVLVCGLARSSRYEFTQALIHQAGASPVHVLDDEQMTRVPAGTCPVDWYSEHLVPFLHSLASESPGRWLVLSVSSDADLRELLDALLYPVGAQAAEMDFKLHAVLSLLNSEQVAELAAIQTADHLRQAELLVSQIEYSDCLILGRSASSSLTQELVAYDVIHKLQTRSQLFPESEMKACVELALMRELFSESETMFSARVNRVRTDENEDPQDAIHLEWVRPLHPERFSKVLELWPRNILRAEGALWLANRPKVLVSFSQVARDLVIVGEDGPWDEWLPPRTEFSLVGDHLDRLEFKKVIESCFLTPEEETWAPEQFRDPFPELNRGQLQSKTHLQLVKTPLDLN